MCSEGLKKRLQSQKTDGDDDKGDGGSEKVINLNSVYNCTYFVVDTYLKLQTKTFLE